MPSAFSTLNASPLAVHHETLTADTRFQIASGGLALSQAADAAVEWPGTKVTVEKAFVAGQGLRSVLAANPVEYKFAGIGVHLLVPGMSPVIMTRKEFSRLLSDGTLRAA